ncbi:MAG: fibronectin type III domain-containing protein [Paenibacillaceae bacterium]|nr:fibronectin type III domain-containing protein [Paenibacillaceae bacterium]
MRRRSLLPLVSALALALGLLPAYSVGTLTASADADTTPPAAVANLAAGSATAGSLQLTWTAPGDDGSTGTATSYDIRVSTSPITAANFTSALLVKNIPAPAAAGSNQSLTVTLPGDQAYYFAMKATDEASNVSALSNVASGTTLLLATGTSGKIPIKPGMIVGESPIGTPLLIADEQIEAGDPKNGAGGAPSTKWDPSFYGDLYEVDNYITVDLQRSYNLSDIYLYWKGAPASEVKLYYGTPFHWTEITKGDDYVNALRWVGYPLSGVTTRYLRVMMTAENARIFNEMVLYGTPTGAPVAPPSPASHTAPDMDAFIGGNGVVDDPLDRIVAFGNYREYHRWQWDEGDTSTSYPGYPNNQNKFNPSYMGGGKNFDKFYQTVKNNGVLTFPTVHLTPPWIANKPIPSGADPVLPASYPAYADHMFQYAARYGSATVADSKLKLASDQQRLSGLNTLQYIEGSNEIDGWWNGRNALHLPFEYAARQSASYDGDQGRMGNTFGVKNADPNLKYVLPGLACSCLNYIQLTKMWADEYRSGSFPGDVINIHVYANNGTNQSNGTVGISPEAFDLKGKMAAIADYRDRYLPGKEFWVSEFGYDTNSGSPQRAPAIGSNNGEEVQAQWLVRSFFALAAAGVDKAQMFTIADDGYSNNTSKFMTSGTIDAERKPKSSWYYLNTMKNRLAGLHFKQEETSGNANVSVYSFANSSGTVKAYAVWAPTSNATTVSGYQLQLPTAASSAKLITMAKGSPLGTESSLTIDGSHRVGVNVSERPVFVLLDNATTYSAPSWASGSAVTISNDTGATLDLSWPAATDDEGVVAYRIKYPSEESIGTVNAGDPLTFHATGLNAATTYTFIVEAVDKYGLDTQTDLQVVRTPGGSADTTAPAAVGNLAAGSATSSSVQLTWTAPGDDGTTGTASAYDIRYSTSAITSANWASATQASGEPAPAAAGTSQSMTVGGLTASTTYYFALKTRDEVPNESALSNVVSLATTAVPPGGGKIVLTTAMVTNEGGSGYGDATKLVDEQTTAGDPKNGTGGDPTTLWSPGWSSSVTYPASAYIDLGQYYDLTDIYLRDSYDIDNYVVSAGSPGNWTTLFTDPLTEHHYWSAHPVSVSTRYVRVTMNSGHSQVTEIVLYGSPSGSADTTAPAAVSNLAAGSATSSSVQLTWTSPGDDGTTGTAAAYDIRYSTSAITSGNWASATQASGEPAPAAAGTSQSMTVSGLSASTTYYFALKTRDEVPNESALSNVPSATTSAPPAAGKLTLTTAMVTNEGAYGIATRLVDEQTTAGDPKNGSGGTPTSYWQPGSPTDRYPASAYIDLGQTYTITDIYLHDKFDNGNITVSYGTPGSWTSLFVDPMTNYGVWNAHPVSITTRYIRVTLSSERSQTSEIVLYGSL